MKLIRKLTLFDRLFARFATEDIQGSERIQPTLAEQVQPVTSFDDLAKTVFEVPPTNASVSGTGWVQIGYVPARQRWHIHSIRVRVSTGTYTFGGLGIERGNLTSSQHTLVDATAATVILYSSPHPLIMDAGDKLWVYVDAFTGAGNAQISVWGLYEDYY